MAKKQKQVFALNLREDSSLEKQLANFLKDTSDNKKKIILALMTHGASLLGKHMNESDSPTCNGVFFNRVVFSEVLGLVGSSEVVSSEKRDDVSPNSVEKAAKAETRQKLQGLTS